MKFKQIKETCLYVADLERTQNFYEEKLGLKMIGKVENRHVFFRAGTSVLLCFISEATSKDTELPTHSGTGSSHLAFEVPLEEYEKSKELILSKKIEIIQEKTWRHGLKSFYFRDPDNHLLEIVVEGMWD
jgi:catechol 2,3-dioxygenase-like lactoylglutathione lyase family enzyme